jgi:hypothetical protein
MNEQHCPLFSELHTEEGGQWRLLIVEGPCATVNANIVGVEAVLPVGWVISHAGWVVVGTGNAWSEGFGLLGNPWATTEAWVVGVKASLPVLWVFNNACLVVSNARWAWKHAECFVLIDAGSNAGIVGAKAGLPIHGVVGNTSLVVGGARSARGERNSEQTWGATDVTC